jgi:hypothetical protein
MQQDPAGMIDGPNMYAYVRNNPVNGRDPTGMKFEFDERSFGDCLANEFANNVLKGLALCLFTVIIAKLNTFITYVTSAYLSFMATKYSMGLSLSVTSISVIGVEWLIAACFPGSVALGAVYTVMQCGWDALGSSEDIWYPEDSMMMNYPLAYSPGSMIYQWGPPGPIVTNWLYSGGTHNPKAQWWMI